MPKPKMEKPMTDALPTNVTDRDLYITRSFDAPVDVVWKFWTQPEFLSQWFGPVGIHTPVDSITIDPRPGGEWSLTMVSDETGEKYPMTAQLVEVVENELIYGVEESEMGGNGKEMSFLRVQFHDHGDKTRITLHQGPFTEEFKEMTSNGWEDSFKKMDAIFAASAA
jgi:uncharacterized protein YndB with AHSA1/START domain